MLTLLFGLLCGFVIGYGVGLLMGKWDDRIKNGGR